VTGAGLLALLVAGRAEENRDRRLAMPISSVEGVTLVVGVPDMAEALRFYGRLFGRSPDFTLEEDFQEYEVIPGMWYQLTTRVAPGRSRRVRFGVTDITAERRQLLGDGVDVSEITGVAGVVGWCQFSDPFGNPLGLFQDLAIHPDPALLHRLGAD
jgi:predicted enzyme related to lactoylglutathione lyase